MITTLRVYLKPAAKQNAILGFEETPYGLALKVHIKAPPLENKANKALVVFLAKCFSIKQSAITLEKGSTSRLKSLTINLSTEALLKCIEENITKP